MVFWANLGLAPWVAAVVPVIHESRQPGHPKVAVIGHTVGHRRSIPHRFGLAAGIAVCWGWLAAVGTAGGWL
jgi:hypothetical protein